MPKEIFSEVKMIFMFLCLEHTFPEAEPYVSDKENIGIRFEKRRK